MLFQLWILAFNGIAVSWVLFDILFSSLFFGIFESTSSFLLLVIPNVTGSPSSPNWPKHPLTNVFLFSRIKC